MIFFDFSGFYVTPCRYTYKSTCVAVIYNMIILEGPRKTLSTDRPFLRPQPFITVMNPADGGASTVPRSQLL